MIFNLLPCGCISIGVDHLDSSQTESMYAECRWCSAAFSCEDLRAWTKSDSHRIDPGLFGLTPKMLLLSADRLFEVISQCGCAKLLVRERGQKDIAHLESAEGVSVLRN